jgi:glycosyltransferase involved in cell wall biosynthesis
MKQIEKGLFSIITVVLNGEKFIEETIKSVLEQNEVNLEYIIIDGGSIDCTIERIKKYQRRIDVFISEKDNGIYDAINKGISLAHGEIVGILNCGDQYLPGVLSKVYQEFKKSSADVLYGDIIFIEELGSGEKKFSRKANHQKLGKEMSVFHPSSFISMNCYLRNGYYDLSYKIAADYDLLLRNFLNNASFTYIPLELAIFRLGGISTVNFKQLLHENYNIRKKNLGKIEALLFLIYRYTFESIYSFRRDVFIFLFSRRFYNKIKLFFK